VPRGPYFKTAYKAPFGPTIWNGSPASTQRRLVVGTSNSTTGICRSGATSGEECGLVLVYTHYTNPNIVTPDVAVWGFDDTDSETTRSGDSGMPVYTLGRNASALINGIVLGGQSITAYGYTVSQVIAMVAPYKHLAVDYYDLPDGEL
jgi:hypothetical protein